MKISNFKKNKDEKTISSANELYRSYQADLIFPTQTLKNKFLKKNTFSSFHNNLCIEEDKCHDFLIMTNSSTVYGMALIEMRPFETNIFKKKMGMLHIKLKDKDNIKFSDIKKFINAANSTASADKYEHISIKIPVNNATLINSLQECGYINIASLVTLVYIKGQTFTKRLKNIFKVRPAHIDDMKKILKISENAFSGTRFINDPSLDKSKCSKLYREWINNCFDSGWASNVFVAVNSQDKVVGFLTYLIDYELKKKVNITKIGRGLAACLPDSKGAFISIFQTSLAFELKKSDPDFIEYTTPLENLEMISICNRIGLELCKIEHIFRKNFDS